MNVGVEPDKTDIWVGVTESDVKLGVDSSVGGIGYGVLLSGSALSGVTVNVG